ncbi:MAG: acyltransferase [Acidiferrobacterales bacterium]
MRSVLWSVYVLYVKVRGPRTATRAVYRCHRKLRVRILQAFGATIGQTTRIHGPLLIIGEFHDFSALQIGSQTHVGADTLFDLTAPINIGDRVTISPRCSFLTHLNVGQSALQRIYPPTHGGVAIGNDAYLGTGATVLHGVKIGECALVAAGALVERDVPPYTLVAGVPARPVKRLDTIAQASAGHE